MKRLDKRIIVGEVVGWLGVCGRVGFEEGRGEYFTPSVLIRSHIGLEG